LVSAGVLHGFMRRDVDPGLRTLRRDGQFGGDVTAAALAASASAAGPC